MTYLVLIDSNAIIGSNYRLYARSFKNFFSKSQLVLAKPTVMEVIKNFEQKQDEKRQEVLNSIKNADRFGVNVELHLIEKENFPDKFNQKLKMLNTKILPNKNVNIDFILNKSLSLQRPFRSNNKKQEIGGFRDVLIWGLWLEHLENHHHHFNKIIIVNMDRDFVNGEKLQDDLIKDLNDRNIPHEKILVKHDMKSLREFVIKHQEQEELSIIAEDSTEYNATTITEELLSQIKSEIIDFSLEKGLAEEMGSAVRHFFSYQNEPQIDLIERRNKIEMESILCSGQEYYVYFTEEFFLSIEYFMNKVDYYTHPHKNVEILDNDWNDWTMAVQEYFTIQVGFEAFVDKTDHSINESSYYVDLDLTSVD